MDHCSMGGSCGMSGMGGSAMDDSESGPSCVISMLWNWNTVDACFISSSWQIKSTAMFAGSCIGVIFLVMSLELLRRLAKEYESYIFKQYQRHVASLNTNIAAPASKDSPTTMAASLAPPFRPNLLQQLIRATLHMLQFAVAYFIMLLAMYFNGYIIICIFIGAWIGAFVFSWETVNFRGGTGVKDEPTVCCG